MVRRMLNKYLTEKQQKNFKNQNLIEQILNALHSTTSRRTSQSYSLNILKDVLHTLSSKYYFTKYIQLNELTYYEEGLGIVKFSPEINNIDPEEIGKFIESLIRVASLNMKNVEAGLYFITELKEQLSERYILLLQKYGTDLNMVELEQQYIFKQNKRKSKLPARYALKQDEENKPSFVSTVKYKWENVGSWEYKDNICTIYDKKGKKLDSIPLDLIIKDYVLKVTGYENSSKLPKEPEEINEKEYEFIKLLHSKDINSETAMKILDLTEDELYVIVRKLLVNDVLSYVSHDEVKLTDNGIRIIKYKK